MLDLITALDDTIDLMKDIGRRMMRYGVEFTPAVRATTEIGRRLRPGRGGLL